MDTADIRKTESETLSSQPPSSCVLSVQLFVASSPSSPPSTRPRQLGLDVLSSPVPSPKARAFAEMRPSGGGDSCVVRLFLFSTEESGVE